MYWIVFQYLVSPVLGGKLDFGGQIQNMTGQSLGTLCSPAVLACSKVPKIIPSFRKYLTVLINNCILQLLVHKLFFFYSDMTDLKRIT